MVPAVGGEVWEFSVNLDVLSTEPDYVVNVEVVSEPFTYSVCKPPSSIP